MSQTTIYQGFTQTALDAAYNNRAAEPRLPAIKEDWARRSKAVYARSRAERNIAYGPGARQTLDILPAAHPDRPTVAFIHGGYWQGNEKEDYAFVAEGLLQHDLNVALIEYTLAPQARMSDIVAEIRAAVAWLVGNGQTRFGANAGLVLCGHSAGGHLTATAAGLPGVTAAIPISGLFDLEPIRLSYLNAPLKMDKAEAGANSPMLLPLAGIPQTVAVGAAELPELVRQSREFAARLFAAGRPARELLLPGDTHFSILEQLARPDGTLCLEAVRLASPQSA